MSERRWTRMAPWGVTALLLPVLAVSMQAMGRRWWCACGQANLWASDVWSSHNSQHLADHYSFSHISHGLVFFGAIWLIPPLRRLSLAWRFCIASAIEVGWEILENTPWVIERYRSATMALGYEGDSIVNALGDVGCAMIGFLIAARVGWRWSLGLLVGLEVLLLVTIRDNLALNVLMLVWPVEAIKAWQTAGQG